MISIKEAQDFIKAKVASPDVQIKPLNEAIGFIISENIKADRDYPPFNRSAMDGFAIRAADVIEKKIVKFRIAGEIFAGSESNFSIPSGSCARIMTGAPVPDETDVVIKREDCQEHEDFVSINSIKINPGLNIAFRGKDCRKGEIIFKGGQLCDSVVIGIMASTGNYKVNIFIPPEVAIVSTGDEIIPIDKNPLSYQIRDSNSYTIKAMLKPYGISPAFAAIVGDDKESLRKTLARALQSDIVIISGGVSMGDADYVPEILESLGVEKIFHKVKIKPGKPLWFGRASNDSNTVVFGLPGNPFSCQVTFKVFIEPYLRKYFRLEPLKPLLLPLAEKRMKKGDREDYFPCRIINDTVSKLVAINFNGSGDIKAALGSNGIAVHPATQSLLPQGVQVKFYPWQGF